MAEHELITTAPCPRTAVFRGRAVVLASTTDDGQPPLPPRLRRRRNRWHARRRICLGTCHTGKGAKLVHPGCRQPARRYCMNAAWVWLLGSDCRPGSAGPGSGGSPRTPPTAPVPGRRQGDPGPGRPSGRVTPATPDAAPARVALRGAGGAIGVGGPPVAGAGANCGRCRRWPWLVTRASRPRRSGPRRPCACPGEGSGTGRAAGLRRPGLPSRR
jgi:hypothetical protein